jgi:hypothetical protein
MIGNDHTKCGRTQFQGWEEAVEVRLAATWHAARALACGVEAG